MKKKDDFQWPVLFIFLALFGSLSLSTSSPVFAQAVPGGTLNPLSIPKYVTPLVIPPAMPKSVTSPAPAADYDIAVRQFKQQILPGGIWGSVFSNPTSTTGGTIGPFPATTVWSYGRAADPAPDSSAIGGAVGVAPATNSTFNYPAFTVENTAMLSTKVRWINDLVNPATGNFLPHLFNVDQTLHWANPPAANCIDAGLPANRTDCHGGLAAPYTGPVPLITHVHGAHVQPHSDGYPEAWYLPGAPGTKGIPASYAERGSHFGQADNSNTVAGSAFFNYENTQAATTLWYHDHALGMTRLNVYAGPAGFWLLRGGAYDKPTGLPGPAPTTGGGDPNFSAAVRATIREIPIAIQDRSFNSDGSLFYPADRTFFDGFTGPFIGGTGTPAGPSDMSPIWNPEAFFNTMVVNGTTWPKFEVAPTRYRLRLLDGCNSRTLNLSMFIVSSLTDSIPGNGNDVLGAEVPFYQIGAEQGFLPKVVKIMTGLVTVLPGNGTIPAPVSAPSPSQGLLLMPAERADVIVDFSGMPNGTRIRMINTGPDFPFQGFPTVAADPLTSGQVMDFIVNNLLSQPTDSASTQVQNLVLPAEPALAASTSTRKLSLNEMSSDQVCVSSDPITGAISGTIFSTTAGDATFQARCAAATPILPTDVPGPMGPRMALLGVVATSGVNLVPVPKMWSDLITENPALNSIETWEIYNTTVDAHPVHVHLVGFEVVNRQALDPAALLLGNLVATGPTITPHPTEVGYKDTVAALPGMVTRIKAKFDISGLYVWHCHIVEHEDNEMMRPYIVGKTVSDLLWRDTTNGDVAVWTMSGMTQTGFSYVGGAPTGWVIAGTADFNGDGQPDILWRETATGNVAIWTMSGTTQTGFAFVGAAPSNWQIAGAGDFNGDSKPDILWRNATTGLVAIWTMNGLVQTGYVEVGTAPLAAQIVGVGDFNGDLKLDILWNNAGALSVWTMNGMVQLGTLSAGTAPANSSVSAVGDLNHDALPDILWRNTTTGAISLWTMHGVTQTGTVAIGSAPTTWVINGMF